MAKVDMLSDVEAAAECWSAHANAYSGSNTGVWWWEAGPSIQEHINFMISGDSQVDWLTYTAAKYFSGKLPLAQCLSLGCGTGHLERSLARLNVFRHCDAFDVAEGAVSIAQQKAVQEGFANISYHIADVNSLALAPGSYDAVWIHSAMHHFQELEHVCSEIKHSLTPEGLLIMNEYVGPSQFQFSARQKEVANLCLRLLPVRYRQFVSTPTMTTSGRSSRKRGMRWLARRAIDKFRDRDLVNPIVRRLQTRVHRIAGQPDHKAVVTFPSRRDVTSNDPSEAIRSSDILTVLRHDFEIIEQKPWGGNLVQFLLAGIAGNFSDDSPGARALLEMLFQVENAMIATGEFDSDYAYLVARPRKTL